MDAWLLLDTRKYRKTIRKNRACKIKNLEDMPVRESSKNKRSIYRPNNEKPLYNFLKKNVGQKWDDIYSELCKKFDKKTFRGFICHDILWRLVAKNPTGEGFHDFFIEDGILHETESPCMHSMYDPSKYIYKPYGRHYDKYFAKLKNENGDVNWYELTVEPIDVPEIYISDPLYRAVYPNYQTFMYPMNKVYELYGDYVRCISWRQLSAKETKKIIGGKDKEYIAIDISKDKY